MSFLKATKFSCKKNGKIESQIPFRSVLLGTDWKDMPLNPETLKILSNPTRDQRVRDWIDRKNAPIRFWIKHPEAIDQLIKPFLEQDKFTLSFYRKQGIPLTVKDLKRRFGDELSNVSQYPQFWAAVFQKQLENTGWFKPYTVNEGETLPEIASKLRIDVLELYRMNQGLKEPLHPGMKLKVKDDLTANSISSMRQRRKIGHAVFSHAFLGSSVMLFVNGRTNEMNFSQMLKDSIKSKKIILNKP